MVTRDLADYLDTNRSVKSMKTDPVNARLIYLFFYHWGVMSLVPTLYSQVIKCNEKLR